MNEATNIKKLIRYDRCIAKYEIDKDYPGVLFLKIIDPAGFGSIRECEDWAVREIEKETGKFFQRVSYLNI